MTMPQIVKSVGEDQGQILRDILALYVGGGPFELDPTYSKGNFYKKYGVDEPLEKFDLYPQTEDTLQADAAALPHLDGQVESIMFDPPFLAGYTKAAPTGAMGQRFHGFRYVADLWAWYSKCLAEFARILQPGGVLVFKCQDTVSSGRQHWSHVYIINQAEALGLEVVDLFVLVAKNRMIGHNHGVQIHARKYHSYFLVIRKPNKRKGAK